MKYLLKNHFRATFSSQLSFIQISDISALIAGVIAGIVVGCLAFLAGVGAAIRAVLTGNCGWFSQKYSDSVQASPGDEESFWGCFAKNSDSGSEVKMDNLMKTDK